MSVYFSSSNYKRYGPQRIIDNADAVVAVKAPAKADSWAAFMAKVIAQASITGADVNIADVGNDLRTTINAKSGIDPSGVAADTDDLCMAVIDTVNQEVLVCTDATDRIITNETGDTVDLPAMVIWSREQSAVA